jgi:hypothetical protein
VSLVEDLLVFELIQPGDRVFAEPYRINKERYPHGWGTVIKIDEDRRHIRVHYDNYDFGAWGTVLERITKWQPAKERTEP